MTKVLHVNRNYMATVLHRLLIDHLNDLGVENDVFTPLCKYDVPVLSPRENEYAPCCFNKIDRYCFEYKQMKIYRALTSRFDVSQYDCIHAYTLFTDGNVAYKASKKYGVPYVVAIRNTDVNAFFKKLFYLRRRGVKILLGAKKIFFLSNAYKDFVFGRYVPGSLREELENKTLVVPNGIDPFWFEHKVNSKTLSSKTEPKLLLVGLVCKNKNIELVQDAVDLLRSRGIQASLTVVGRVQDEALLKRIKSRPHTTYHTPVSKEGLIDIYRSHDVMVLPSLTETFGLVYAEAMSQGLPVVYSRGQGFDRQFDDGVAGYSVDSHSADEIAHNIEQILEQYSTLSMNCVQLVDKFRWTSIAETCKRVYAEQTSIL